MDLLWLLLMWSPLCLPSLAYPIRRLKRTSENNEVLHVSLEPTAIVQLSTDQTNPLNNGEQNTLRKLVSLLQDMVMNFPTRRAQSQVPTQEAPVGTSNIAPSPTVKANALLVSLNFETGGTPTETAALADTMTTSTTPLENNGSNMTATVIIHSDVAMSEKTTPESLQNMSNVVLVVPSDNALPEQSAATEFLLVEDNQTVSQKDKTFDQLTNGALSNLVESLKSVETSTEQPSYEGPQKNNGEGQQNKSAKEDILELISVEIKSIASAPPSIKNDPALSYYLKKSERFLKDALQRAGEAEEMLNQNKEQEQEKTAEQLGSPSPSAQLAVSEVAFPLTPASSNSLAKKTKDAQLESGKLTALIKLLYSFSPHLMGEAENPPNK